MSSAEINDNFEHSLAFDRDASLNCRKVDNSFLGRQLLILVVAELLIVNYDKPALVPNEVAFALLFKPPMDCFVLVNTELVMLLPN